MLGSQGRLFCLFGRGRGRRGGNRGLKVRLAEKVLRAELCQELGESLSQRRVNRLRRQNLNPTKKQKQDRLLQPASCTSRETEAHAGTSSSAGC
jgi:hypothetical protein